MSWQGEYERRQTIAARQRELCISICKGNEPGAGAMFNTFVLKDEKTGRSISNAPFHLDWHLMLQNPAYRQIVLWSHIESAKSNSITVGHTLRSLGRNPRLRVAIVSKTIGQSKKLLNSIKQYIEGSVELHTIYPHLRPSEHNWTKTSITVDYGGAPLKDPSVIALGYGAGVLGARIDLLIIDDLLDHKNVHSDAARKEVISWFMSTLYGRLSDEGRVICLGTAWHPEDLYHLLASKEGWASFKYPVRYPDGRLNWPERWSNERIQTAMNTMIPIEVGRQLFCQPSGDDDGGFEQSWIDKSLALGRGAPLVKHLSIDDRLSIAANGQFVVIGCDPASGKKKRKRTNAATAFTVTLFHPNGANQVLWVETGALGGPGTRDTVIDLYKRFGAPVFVEDNGVQNWMQELVQEVSDVPIYAFNTNSNKRDPVFGVESIGNSMEQGKVLFPSRWDEGQNRYMPLGQVSELVADCRSFHPKHHTGDTLMSFWISREGARSLKYFNDGSAAGAAIA